MLERVEGCKDGGWGIGFTSCLTVNDINPALPIKRNIP